MPLFSCWLAGNNLHHSGALSSTKVVLYARNACSGDRVPAACEVVDVVVITHRRATIYANPCDAITRVPEAEPKISSAGLSPLKDLCDDWK